MKKKSITSPPIVSIQHWKSKKGMHVYFVQRPEIPIVDIDIFFNAGSSMDEKKQGLSHITSAMLNQGTRSYDADDIANKFADVGAHFQMHSTKDNASVSLKCLSEKKYFNLAFKLFLEILYSAQFPKTAFSRRQKQIFSTLQMQEQTPSYIAQNAFSQALYGKHPYAHNLCGTKEAVMSLTRNDAEYFYQQYYVLSNATLIIVGNISRHDVEKNVARIEDSFPVGKEAPITPNAVSFRNKVQTFIPFPSEQTTIWMGHLGMEYHDPDYYAIHIGNDILGGSSITSRLFKKIRGEHGLVYGINSAFQFFNARGFFLIHFATQNSTAKKALNLTKSILDHYIDKGPTEKEFLLAKQKINHEFPLSIATNHDIIHYLMQIGFYKLPLDYIDTYRANISAISLNEVKTALKKHIKPDEMIKIIVGGSG
ncbi:MAG: non-proteolytic protein peptidase family [Gammaproteobacteria bacterium]|jgi:zinc protease|nr:non-proteolytic protein peptidase family [Gammaproteobacteria bacterium]